MLEVKFYDQVDDSVLKFAVIIAKTNGQWVFCKHRESEKILITDQVIDNWTYPLIQPPLIIEARKRGYLQ